MSDLEPYICLSEDCVEPHRLFRDRASWLSHMLKEHTIQWRCTAPGHSPCVMGTEEAFEDHMRSAHTGAFTEAQLPWLEKRSRGPASTIFTFCLLCEHVPSEADLQKESVLRGMNLERDYDRKRLLSECLVKHTATQLEYVSLISLPWQDDITEDALTEKSASGQAEQGTRKSDEEEPELWFEDKDNDMAMLQASRAWLDETKGYTTHQHLNPTFEQEWSFIELPRYYGHDRDPKLQTFLRKLYLDSSPAAYNCNGPFLPAYLMPLDPSRNFFGRDFALNAIETALCLGPIGAGMDAEPLAFPRTFAIYASGGMGKTQLAAQFVATHRKEFDAIFWVHADHVSKLSQDFKTIAITLGLISEDSVDANDLVFMREIVKRWLVTPLKDLADAQGDESEKEKATWLLVFDGVEDPDILNDFWPYDGPGAVLITSRSPFSWPSSLPLRPFTSDEATDFLLKLTGREASDEARKAATDVSRQLGGLPLALTQMAGIILHKKLSFDEFLDSYNERQSQQELLQLSAGELMTKSPGYEHTVASVWAFENLTHGQGLLNVVSMLDPDGISEGLLTAKLGTIELQSFPQSLDDYRLARNELLACSLVNGKKVDRKLFMHRLVQDVARARMTQIEFRANFMTCVKLVSSVWPFEAFAWRHGVARWTSCEELFPHVSRLKDLYPQVAPSDTFSDDEYRFAKLLTDAGW